MTARRLRVAHVAAADLTHRFLLLGQLRRLVDEGFDVTAISAAGPWVADVEVAGVRFVPWRHITRAWSPAEDGRAFLELAAILRRGRFDVVHAHTAKAGVMARPAARIAGVPCVLDTVHGLYATPEDRLAKRLAVLGVERAAAWFSDLELYQSEEDLRWALGARVVTRRKAVLLGNGADLARFDPVRVGPGAGARVRGELGIEGEAIVVGTVGRLVAEKGYRELFAAARAVREAARTGGVGGGRPVRFLVAGQLEPKKWDAISQQEIDAAAGDVVFAGWREDIPELMAAMDIFVLPSWREGVPRSAIEAAAMGRPLVVTDVRGCREVVRDGVEGFVVPARDPEHLGKAIRRLIDAPDLRAQMGSAARARAVARYDESAVLDRILLAYRRVLRAHGLDREPISSVDGSGIRIRAAGRRDVAAITRLHREIPYAFLENLGDGFLRRLYTALVTDPAAVALVAENGSGVVGFATGVPSMGSFYRRFALRHGLAAAAAAGRRLLDPGILRRVLETGRYPVQAKGLPSAELVSIAVDPAWRRRNIGEALANGILNGLAAQGVRDVKVMVREENARANEYYRRIGFTRGGTVSVHEGKPSVVWVAACPAS